MGLMMMNLIANIALVAAGLLDMVVLLGGDITAHRDNGHSNSRYYSWLSKSGELLSTKRLLLLAVFLATFTTMAQQSWMVVMLLAATLLIQGIVLLNQRKWKLMAWEKPNTRLLAVAVILALMAVGLVAYFGYSTGAVYSTRIASMVTVMMLPITPLLTMLVTWLLRSGQGINDPEHQEPRD